MRSTSSSMPATSARPRSTTCRCAAMAGSSSRWAWAAWGTASAPASAWLSAGRAEPAEAYRRHRRRRLILHARHGDSHRAAVPAAHHVPAVRQPCARDVRDARAAVLRRPLQLQPVRAEPAGRRVGRDVSRSCGRWTSTTSTRCPPRWRPHSIPTARRSSVSNAPPMKSRRSQPFSATPPLPRVNRTITKENHSNVAART